MLKLRAEKPDVGYHNGTLLCISVLMKDRIKKKQTNKQKQKQNKKKQNKTKPRALGETRDGRNKINISLHIYLMEKKNITGWFPLPLYLLF